MALPPSNGSTDASQPELESPPSLDTLVSEINSESASQQNLPTAVPQALIDAADAEHTLLANLYERLAPSVVFVEVIVGEENQFAIRDVGNGSGIYL